MNRDDCEKHLDREKSMLPSESDEGAPDIGNKKKTRSFNGYYLIVCISDVFLVLRK